MEFNKRREEIIELEIKMKKIKNTIKRLNIIEIFVMRIVIIVIMPIIITLSLAVTIVYLPKMMYMFFVQLNKGIIKQSKIMEHWR